MIRWLVSANLLVLLALLSMASVRYGSELGMADAWYRTAMVEKHERRVCEQRHSMLLTAIRREGLWQRLGMDSQPWLAGKGRGKGE